MTRPRTIEELAPGFARIHADAVARVRKLKAEDLDRPIVFFNGQAMPVRDILMDSCSSTTCITADNCR
jgi:hypothetical protein